jgi:hypothetical protein
MPAAGGGNTTLHQITASPSKTTGYSCSYFEDPRLASESTEQVLNDARDGGVAKIQGNILVEKRLDVNGHPARDLEVRARGNSLVEMRLMTVGRQTFMLMVVDTARQRADTKNVRRFFDSLKFSN